MAELIARGVTRVFALSGNQIMSVFDACIDSGIELVHVRHEAAAVHMADAWGRLTGMPGVALLTAGPGHANALSAMYTAFAFFALCCFALAADSQHTVGHRDTQVFGRYGGILVLAHPGYATLKTTQQRIPSAASDARVGVWIGS